MSYVVCATWTAADDGVEHVAALIRTLATATRSEDGNLVYQVHRKPDDSRIFFLYEEYADEAGYLAHGRTEHFTEALRLATPWLANRERAIYEVWDV